MVAARKPLAEDAAHVLVVDDDRRLRELLARFLGDHGYRVSAAASAGEAEARLGQITFDALVLDVMMPGENGFEFAGRLRKAVTPAGDRLPILMLTARADPADRVSGLEIGADDYLSKPFEPRELLLRLGNIIKRAQPATVSTEAAIRPEAVHFGPFLFRLDRGELRRDGEVVRLTDRERDILGILAGRLGEPVSREDLAGADGPGNERTVDVQINRLRRKIETDPAEPLLLQTVRGTGYRLMIERS